MQDNTQVQIRARENVGIIDISGEVTSFSEKVLAEAYEDLSSKEHTRIALNFEQVSYINSAGMAIIIGILTKSRERKQTLSGWGLTDHFKKIFDMVGISKYMQHYDDEASALTGATD